MSQIISPEQVRDLLRRVPYPGFSRDIVSAGFVKDIDTGDGSVVVHFTPNSTNAEKIRLMEQGIRGALAAAEISDVRIATSQPFGEDEMRRFRDDPQNASPKHWPKKGTEKTKLDLPDIQEFASNKHDDIFEFLVTIDPTAHQAACNVPASWIIADRLLLLQYCLAYLPEKQDVIYKLIDTDFDQVKDSDKRMMLCGSWVAEVGAALAVESQAANSKVATKALIRKLWYEGLDRAKNAKKSQSTSKSPDNEKNSDNLTLGIFVALRASAILRDYELLFETAAQRHLLALAQAASDEIYLAAAEDVEENNTEDLNKLFSIMTGICKNYRSMVRRWKCLKPIAVTCARLFVNYSGDTDHDNENNDKYHHLMQSLLQFMHQIIRLLPRLDSFFSRFLVLPIVIRGLYPFVRRKWNDVALQVGCKMVLEEVCTVREPEMTLLKKVIKLNFKDLPDSKLTRSDFANSLGKRSVRLLLDLGLVCGKDPLFQVRRGLFGSLIYSLGHHQPEWLDSHFVDLYFLSLDKPLPEGYPERPSIDSDDDKKRYGGLFDMMMRHRTYAALDEPNPEALFTLHEKLIRYEIEYLNDVFCQDYNIVGRPSHHLPALSLLEVRHEGSDSTLDRTCAIMTELRNAAHVDTSRLNALAKCIFDMLFTGILAPAPTLAAMGQILDLHALNTGRPDDKDSAPDLDTAAAFLRLKLPDDENGISWMRKAAARAAVVLCALESLYTIRMRAFFESHEVDSKGRGRLRKWAAYSDKAYPLDVRGKLTRDKIVQKYGDQARIGLFMNRMIVSNPGVRSLVTDVIEEWMDYCQKHLEGQRILSAFGARKLLRSIIVKVYELIRTKILDPKQNGNN